MDPNTPQIIELMPDQNKKASIGRDWCDPAQSDVSVCGVTVYRKVQAWRLMLTSQQ